LPPPVELIDTSRGLYKELIGAGYTYNFDRQLWRAWATDRSRQVKESLKYQQQKLL